MARIPSKSEGGTVTWEGDVPKPVTTYAAARSIATATRLSVPASTNRVGSSVVSRRDRRNGNRFFYAHGGVMMPLAGPKPPNNGVWSSAYQRILVHLFDWSTNDRWYEGGYPRNLGYTFRGLQPVTNATGGPTAAAMQQAPVFKRVQQVPRYSTVPKVYATKASRA